MLDLLWGLILIVILSVLCYRLALWITAPLPVWSCEILTVLTLGFMVYYTLYMRDEIWMANYLPFSNLIIIGNWYPLMAGFQAGLVWRRLSVRVDQPAPSVHPALAPAGGAPDLVSTPGALSDVPAASPTETETPAAAKTEDEYTAWLWSGKWYRRVPPVLLLTGIGIYALIHPLQGSTPVCTDTWQDGVCLQTSFSTCSPAAICTLLSSYQIKATEAEMAEKCLTFERGTLWQGIYRGLKLKTEGTPYRPEPLICTLDELKALPKSQILLKVELIPGSGYDPIYEEKWGWSPGQAHTVTFFGFQGDDRALIADPSVGWEYWSRQDMETLWHGQAFRLVERQPESTTAAAESGSSEE